MQTNHPHFPAQLPIFTLTLRAYERREQLWQQVLNDPAQILFVAEDETGKQGLTPLSALAHLVKEIACCFMVIQRVCLLNKDASGLR
jgi:hypothetical protein